MSTSPAADVKRPMTVDDFLAWAEGRPGRWELDHGEPVEMAPERAFHALTKNDAVRALEAAIQRAGIDCTAFPDGMGVRISSETVREPDASVQQGPFDPQSVVLSNPIIVVEVVSPSSALNDQHKKLIEYFQVPSIRHYLIVDPANEMVVHHARGEGDLILTRLLRSGEVNLDPPGLSVPVKEMLRHIAPPATAIEGSSQ